MSPVSAGLNPIPIYTSWPLPEGVIFVEMNVESYGTPLTHRIDLPDGPCRGETDVALRAGRPTYT
jgi:hypothetical protein